MRLYSRIYKYHLQVRLFDLAALVYAKSLKILKHRQFCVKATLMKSNGSANNGGGAEAAADKEATTEQTKKPTRTHGENERVLNKVRNQTM